VGRGCATGGVGCYDCGDVDNGSGCRVVGNGGGCGVVGGSGCGIVGCDGSSGVVDTHEVCVEDIWAQLQREEQATDALSMMSKKLEMIALEILNRGWKHLYRLL
jgi:hypothetical protein